MSHHLCYKYKLCQKAAGRLLIPGKGIEQSVLNQSVYTRRHIIYCMYYEKIKYKISCP